REQLAESHALFNLGFQFGDRLSAVWFHYTDIRRADERCRELTVDRFYKNREAHIALQVLELLTRLISRHQCRADHPRGSSKLCYNDLTTIKRRRERAAASLFDRRLQNQITRFHYSAAHH